VVSLKLFKHNEDSMKKQGFKFKYNEYEKPSSKSYMPLNIKEVDIVRYETTTKDGKSVFKIFTNGNIKLSEIAIEQLTLHFMNLYGLELYSDVVLEIYENNNENSTGKGI